MNLLKSIGAFAFGFVGSVIWLVPVLVLLALAQTSVFWFAALILFTIGWWILWTLIGARLNVYQYTDGGLLLPYAIGGSLGLVFTLYYEVQINALFGV